MGSCPDPSGQPGPSEPQAPSDPEPRGLKRTAEEPESSLLTPEQRAKVAASRAAALEARAKRVRLAKATPLALAMADPAATTVCVVDGIVEGKSGPAELPQPVVYRTSGAASSSSSVPGPPASPPLPTQDPDAGPSSSAGEPSDISRLVPPPPPVGAWRGLRGGQVGAQDLLIPPTAPLPRVRLNLKTRVKAVRLNTKSFSPQQFSGFIGSASRIAHASHSLAGGQGVVWCWKCGKVGVTKPRGLVRPCNQAPNAFGKATLDRLREGKPPYHLKNVWPDGSMFRQLVITKSNVRDPP